MRTITICSLSLWLFSCANLRVEPIDDADGGVDQAPGVGGSKGNGSGGAGGNLDGPFQEGDVRTPDLSEIGCTAGFHFCNGRCVDARDSAHCGTRCIACPTIKGGEATCDGQSCGIRCPAGKKACLSSDECRPADEPCDGMCLDGKTCLAPLNGTAVCVGSACTIRCDDGFHLCGNECKVNGDVTACGAACAKCVAPAAATSICTNGTCSFECNAGRQCNGQCIASDLPCDDSCPLGARICNGRCLNPTQFPSENCSNNLDDDCDGNKDCADGDCAVGTSCGAGRVCQGGLCEVPCVPADCILNGDRCKLGRTSCPTGVCVFTRDKCGLDENCNSGTCSPRCIDGTVCASNQNAGCYEGKMSCSASRCVDDTTRGKCTSSQVCMGGRCLLIDGQNCGGSNECASGVCHGFGQCNVANVSCVIDSVFPAAVGTCEAGQGQCGNSADLRSFSGVCGKVCLNGVCP